jgi:uncharacterized membrane protein
MLNPRLTRPLTTRLMHKRPQMSPIFGITRKIKWRIQVYKRWNNRLGTLLGVFVIWCGFANPAFSESKTLKSIAPGIPEISSGLQFCNKTGEEYIWVAINHYERKTWFREGWWKIKHGDCAVVLSKLQNRYVYYYAHGGKWRWSGDNSYCTRSNAFKIRAGSCPNDAEYHKFKVLDTKSYDTFTMTLQ